VAASQILRQQGQAEADKPEAMSQAVAELYELRQFRLLWTSPELVDQLLLALQGLEADGLNPKDYQLEWLRSQRAFLQDDSFEALEARLLVDMRATNACLRALQHLYNGKVDAEGIKPQWNFALASLPPQVIALLQQEQPQAAALADAFVQTRPQHLSYRSMLAGLVRYRALAAEGGWPVLPVGESLKPGMSNPQVAILRKRLQITGEYADAIPVDIAVDEYFDEPLAAAVKRFQAAQYLDADGAVGVATRSALNISAQARVEQIRVNLDRARWLLHQLPDELVLVDIAGYKVTYYKARQPIWSSRVQVGMAYRTTPLFKSAVNYITLNPTWTVPPTILRKDLLPKVRQDPGYLRKNNIRVFDAQARELAPETIDWQRPGNVTLRQDAGPKAALGKAVIRFPNSHSIYLHDTQHQELFNKSQRAFSSGCIRVERVLELVELLLSETPQWDSAAITSALNTGKTRNVTLARPVTILLAYWTVDAIDEEQLAFKPDIYARDQALLTALNSFY
jgi:L,D-transpeptidase YcbB